ncbi:MAG: hypothetical protein OXP71_04105 [Candidatus Poribacteria bacterium]|nr:hypothetical protein [Candidatus Poribacteria bacterium]
MPIIFSNGALDSNVNVFLSSSIVNSVAPGAHGLHGFTAHGLQGLHGFAAHGLQGLHGFAAHGLQGLQGFDCSSLASAQGLQGFSLAKLTVGSIRDPIRTKKKALKVNLRKIFFLSTFCLLWFSKTGVYFNVLRTSQQERVSSTRLSA